MVELQAASEGDYFTLFLLADGTVYSSGNNENYELGFGARSLQVDIPQKIPGLKSIVKIATGCSHSLALNNKGYVYGWGTNQYCEIDPASPEFVNKPRKVSFLKDIISISAALDYSLALDKVGNVWEWGVKQTKEWSRLISGYPRQYPDLSNIVYIGATDIFCVALDASGSLYVWESPSNYNRSSNFPKEPSVLPFDKKILAASVGDSHALLLAEDGNLYGFGSNFEYSLINNYDIDFFKTPVRLKLGNARSLKSFVAGKTFSALLTKSDKVYLWGSADLLNTDTTSFIYHGPSLVPISDDMYKRALFSNNSTSPPCPQETEIAWRKVLSKAIAL